MKRKITCLLLAAILAFSMVATGCAAKFDAASARESVVFILEDVYNLDNSELGAWRGTGFFVNSTTIVTNHHVISDYLAIQDKINALPESTDELKQAKDVIRNANASRIYLVFDSNNIEEAYVIDYDIDNDLAVLRIDAPTELRKPVKLEVPTEAMVSDTVYAVGYPGAVDNYVTDPTEKYDIDAASVTKGSITRLFTSSGSGMNRVQTDAAISGGNSGGPLFTEYGSVVGVNSSHLTNATDTAFAVNTSAVTRLLDKNGIEYTMYKNNTLPIVLIVVAIVVAAAIVVVGIVLIIVFATKKSKSKAPKAAPGNTPVNMGRKPTVRSLSPQHNGLMVAVGTQPVVFGRDGANCQVVYHKDTAGISAHHCQITWDPEQRVFKLTDLKSTYGTFLANDQKLTPGIPVTLHSGDSFYLAEKANMIIVEEA